MYRVILYRDEIAFAFGEPPDFGKMKLASASGASTSEAISALPSTSASRARAAGRLSASGVPSSEISRRARGLCGRRGRWRGRRRGLASLTSGRKAAAFYPAEGRDDASRSVGLRLARRRGHHGGRGRGQPDRRRLGSDEAYRQRLYWRHLRVSRAIRATACALVAAGVAAPVVRRRAKLPPIAVLSTAALAPAALMVAVPRGRARDLGVCMLNMWAYLAAYEMPHDDPGRQAARVRIEYPIVIDRVLGLGVPPTVRLQRRFSTPGAVNGFERVLVWCHWLWFFVPHGSVVYVLLRKPERFPQAAARMYAVFDLGAVFYWAIPTAPPWWAAQHGHLGA